MQKITPFIWFNTEAEEAAKFYVSVFKNAKILAIAKYDESGAAVSGRPKGSVMTVSFTIEGQEFTALNGGKVPGFELSPATSFVVNCDTQKEIDHLWNALSKGGAVQQCGWLTDKYGVTWQIVPSMLEKLFAGADKKAAERAMQAMLKMVKLDIQKLEDAYNGK